MPVLRASSVARHRVARARTITDLYLMHRHWTQRVFAMLLVAWFTALVAEPVTLHPCPMHDGVLLMMSSQSQMAGHAMDMSAMAHEHTTPQADHDQMPGHQQGGQHQCTCLGTCTAASSAGLPSAHVTLASALVVHAHNPGLPDYRYVPVAAQHVLPFAHGPPLSPLAL